MVYYKYYIISYVFTFNTIIVIFFWRVIKLVVSWSIELLKGIGKLFLNPLTYWSVFLMFLVGYKRIKVERKQFGLKLFESFSEWISTWKLSLFIGLFISLITIGGGMVFSYDTIILLGIVTIILSLTFNYSMLSPSYTIGFTFILILLSPLILEKQSFINQELFTGVNFTSLAVLLGLFLFIEAILLMRTERNATYPELVLSERGVWIGQHRLKKLSIIPFFVIVPSGLITPFAPFWPFFDIGGESYGLLLIPFLLGFNHVVRGALPQLSAKKLAKSMTFLAFLVLVIALGSIYEPLSWFSIIAVIIAILGREFINFKHRINDKEVSDYFQPIDDGVKVLGVIQNSPADRLGILVGEKIVKVNSQKIYDRNQFYNCLSDTSVNFKLEIIDDAGEMRYVQSSLYEGDHHELGIIFASKPYRK